MLYLSGVVRSDLPAMLTPRMGQRPPPGMKWAGDTGRFNSPHEYSDEKYLAWLRKMQPYVDRCLFVTAPDVVGDAAATLLLSLPMLPQIRDLGFPVGFVGQDGLTSEMVPWDDIDAYFVGGTTDWKLSPESFALAAEAKSRGKWVHMGRVNSRKRFLLANSHGFDSADGTVLRFDPKRPVHAWVAEANGLGLGAGEVGDTHMAMLNVL